MSNGVLSWVNRVDESAASLTADTEAATLGVANLQDQVLFRAWRTVATTVGFFVVDFGAAYPIRLLMLGGCTLASTDTVRHRLSAVSAGAGELLDTGAVASGVQTGYGRHAKLLDAAVTARYWRCDINAASRASQGYFQIGRAWAGPALQFTINYDWDFVEANLDTSRSQRSAKSGVRYTDIGARLLQHRFSLGNMPAADKDEIKELSRIAGLSGQVAFIADPESDDLGRECNLGALEEVPAISFAYSGIHDVFKAAFTVTEDK